MITGRKRFNIYLLLIPALLASGCHTAKDPKKPEAKKDKSLAALRVHLEVLPDAMDYSMNVPIFRDKPVMVTVDKAPFLTEADVAEAKIVDEPGGFSLQIKFARQGSWLLEESTTTHPGKHLAIYSEFGTKKKQNRWLAAPIIVRRISNGTLIFAPDASREEVEEIVIGLNNVAKKVADNSKW
jgi:hypothetical protein